MKLSKLIEAVEKQTGKKLVLKESEQIKFLDTDNALAQDMFLENLVKKVPYYKAWFSTLGYQNTLFLTVGFDKKEDWSYNIFENSNYFKMSIKTDGTMEVFTQSLYPRIETKTYETRLKVKFRKTKAKDIQDAIKKLNAYIDLIKKELK